MSLMSRAGHKYLQSTFEYSTNPIVIVSFKLTQPIGWFAVALHVLFTLPILKVDLVLAIVISFEKGKIFVYFRLHSSINMPMATGFRLSDVLVLRGQYVSEFQLPIWKSQYQEKALYYWSAKMSRFRGNCIKQEFFLIVLVYEDNFWDTHTRW